MILGGDHSIGFPTVRGIAQCTSKRIGIVHFDRHADIQERDLDAEKLASLATSILQDLPTYKRMAKAARDLAVPDAADRVCAAIEATLLPS